MTLHIHAPPGYWHETKQTKECFCFECRKQTVYRLRLWCDKSGWYEPTPTWRCEVCGEEAWRFPGREL